MSKIHFVTFGCDNVFKYSRERLKNEAFESGWFDKIFIYQPNDLLEYNIVVSLITFFIKTIPKIYFQIYLTHLFSFAP